MRTVLRPKTANNTGKIRTFTRRMRPRYFVCGPLAMMDAMEKLLPDMGIAPEYIHTERFDIV